MLSFIAAVYNEEDEITDLLEHVHPYVDYISIADDKSVDGTVNKLTTWWLSDDSMNFVIMPEHSGLPETVKNEALFHVPNTSWVLMLDADERFADGVLPQIREWLKTAEALKTDYVYFQQLEIIDGKHVRTFQKAKLFRKENIKFPLNNIHADDEFIGNGIYKSEWVVLHRKTTAKQIKREKEYLQTYLNLLSEGKIDKGRYEWLKGLHHYEREL